MTKEQIRVYQKKQRDSLSQEDRAMRNKMIRRRLQDSAKYHECRRLFAFVSFRSEVDTHDIIRQALEDGKEVFVPRVEDGGMEFYRIYDLDGLVTSSFGVPEPVSSGNQRFREEINKPDRHETEISDQQIVLQSNKQSNCNNLMLMPGLAFDRTGNRIGYGAGYYDRYLLLHPTTDFYKIALAYEFQIMTELPTEEYDIRVDEIISPDEVIRCET